MKKYTVKDIAEYFGACKFPEEYLNFKTDLEGAWNHALKNEHEHVVDFILDQVLVVESSYTDYTYSSIFGTINWQKVRKNYNAQKVVPRVLKKIHNQQKIKEEFKNLVKRAHKNGIDCAIREDSIEFDYSFFNKNEADY